MTSPFDPSPEQVLHQGGQVLSLVADFLAGREGLWLHVDGAYGGFFQLTEQGRAALRGVERADSITLDPHKGLFLPHGTGCLLVRDGHRLRQAHYTNAEYLQDLTLDGTAESLPNFSEHGPEMSRDFRGLRVWLPLHLFGVEAFRRALSEKLELARWLHGALSRHPGLELPWAPALSVVVFRRRAGAGSPDPDAASRDLLERIHRPRRVLLSSTVVQGRFTLRACILSHRTDRQRVEETARLILEAADAQVSTA